MKVLTQWFWYIVTYPLDLMGAAFCALVDWIFPDDPYDEGGDHD